MALLVYMEWSGCDGEEAFGDGDGMAVMLG